MVDKRRKTIYTNPNVCQQGFLNSIHVRRQDEWNLPFPLRDFLLAVVRKIIKIKPNQSEKVSSFAITYYRMILIKSDELPWRRFRITMLPALLEWSLFIRTITILVG